MLMDQDTLSLPFRKWDGEYEKEMYEVRLLDGEVILCWPNAGYMNALDGTNRQWCRTSGIEVRRTNRMR